MIKKAEWINGNHMKIDTPIKTFNDQVGEISTGNIIDSVEYGSYIRCWNDLGRDLYDNQDGKKDRAPGVLTKFDLDGFEHLPNHVAQWVIKYAKETDKTFILYEFHHWSNGRKVVHGYVVTTSGDYLHVSTFVTGPTYKSYGVMAECRKYICEDWETLEIK